MTLFVEHINLQQFWRIIVYLCLKAQESLQ